MAITVRPDQQRCLAEAHFLRVREDFVRTVVHLRPSLLEADVVTAGRYFQLLDEVRALDPTVVVEPDATALCDLTRGMMSPADLPSRGYLDAATNAVLHALLRLGEHPPVPGPVPAGSAR